MGVGALPSRSETHPSAPATVIRALSFHALTHCPFCNSSLFTHMHVMGGVPPSGYAPRYRDPFVPIPHPLSPLFSHPCALFCAFLHSSKTQLFYFQSLPHSLPKTPGGGVRTNHLQVIIDIRYQYAIMVLSVRHDSSVPFEPCAPATRSF